ncbi:acid protease [Suillus paluster]|uniref:acid protease n=1 Tax=Suillus paluster TaxID=48578 RepID=UPI001B85ECEE|nr:acid protease [Suillus paluster]KAG1747768.1 acid protease [Suillus paluster]
MQPFSCWALLFVALVAASRSTSSLVTIPLTKLDRTGSYLQGSPHADRARASFLKTRTTSGSTTVPASNLAYMQYTTSVGVGSPATYYNLVVDTGSSNTFIGTGKTYVRTSTSAPTGQHVNVTYGLGFFTGVEYSDTVTLAPDLVIANQSIGDALQYADFEGVDGIIGVGPVDLTNGTLSPDNTLIPTIMNNALKQGLIKKEILGVLFAPPATYNDTNGVITYGGIDHALYTGKMSYAPVTETYPASLFWGINVTELTCGTHTVIPQSTAGIVDTGTTLVLLADDFFDVYLDAIPGAYLDDDNNTGLLVIPSSSVADMQPLNFKIGDTVFSMDIAAQLVPLDQNTAWGGQAGVQYGVVGKLGTDSGGGLDFIIGQKFMEKYYAVFDAHSNRVGFGYTNHTFSKYSP